MPEVALLIAHAGLRQALEPFLRASGFGVVSFAGSPPPVVVTTALDSPATACAELARQGATVVVLATVPRESERALYLGSGAAAYVAMSGVGDQLLRAIRAAIDGPYAPE